MELKEIIEKLNKTWELYKKALEDITANGKETAEQKAKIEALEKDMSEYEKTVSELQAKMQAPQPQPEDESKKAKQESELRRSAFFKWLRKGVGVLTPDEFKTMVLADEGSLGYLAPPEFWAEIQKNIVEISPIRQFATIRTISARELRRPKRLTTLSASWVTETGLSSETTKTHGQDIIPAHKLAALVKVSSDASDDIGALEQDIRADVIEQFSLAEGTAHISGNGVEKPLGILSDSNVAVTTSGVLNKIDFDDLLDVQFALKEPYWPNARWMANRLVVKYIRKLKDNDGQYIWRPAMDMGSPNTLLGFPFHFATDLASTISTGNKPIIWGDFRAGYIIVDRRDVAFQVLAEKYLPDIGYWVTKRTGGQVQTAEALKILAVK